MSLILDALRKIEREKHAPNRGFVVMTHVPWRREGGSPLLVGVLVLLCIAVAVLGGALWRSSRPRPAAEPPAAVAIAPPPVPVSVPTSPPATPTPAALGAAPTPTPEAAVPPPRATKPRAPARAAVPARPMPTPPPATAAVATPPAPTPKPPVGLGGEIRLHAISRREGQPVAILNDRLVHEGDSFDGVKVLRILDASVEVEVDGKRRTVGF